MRKAVFSVAIAAALSGCAVGAWAQDAPPPPSLHGAAPRDDGPQGHGPRMGRHGPGMAVISDLEQLRRVYAISGHPDGIVAVYNDVLSKTQNPMLRHYIYDSLAREQLKPTNPEQAITTLKASLAEDLAAEKGSPPLRD